MEITLNAKDFIVTPQYEACTTTLVFDDNNTKIEIKFTFHEFENLIDSYREEIEEKTVSELEDENLMLQERLRDRDDYIEQLEEFEDYKRDKSMCRAGIF